MKTILTLWLLLCMAIPLEAGGLFRRNNIVAQAAQETDGGACTAATDILYIGIDTGRGCRCVSSFWDCEPGSGTKAAKTGNRFILEDNGATATDPTCANQAGDYFTIADTDEATTNQWVFCNGIDESFRILDTEEVVFKQEIRLPNVTALAGEVAATGSYIDMVKLDATDDVQIGPAAGPSVDGSTGIMSMGAEVVMGNADWLTWRDNADSADIDVLRLDDGDQITFGNSTTDIRMRSHFAPNGNLFSDDTTPSITGYNTLIIQGTSPYTITDFDDAVGAGSYIYIICGDTDPTLDFTANANMTGNGGVDYTCVTNEMFLCIAVSASVWRCSSGPL